MKEYKLSPGGTIDLAVKSDHSGAYPVLEAMRGKSKGNITLFNFDLHHDLHGSFGPRDYE